MAKETPSKTDTKMLPVTTPQSAYIDTLEQGISDGIYTMNRGIRVLESTASTLLDSGISLLSKRVDDISAEPAPVGSLDIPAYAIAATYNTLSSASVAHVADQPTSISYAPLPHVQESMHRKITHDVKEKPIYYTNLPLPGTFSNYGGIELVAFIVPGVRMGPQ